MSSLSARQPRDLGRGGGEGRMGVTNPSLSSRSSTSRSSTSSLVSGMSSASDFKSRSSSRDDSPSYGHNALTEVDKMPWDMALSMAETMLASVDDQSVRPPSPPPSPRTRPVDLPSLDGSDEPTPSLYRVKNRLQQRRSRDDEDVIEAIPVEFSPPAPGGGTGGSRGLDSFGQSLANPSSDSRKRRHRKRKGRVHTDGSEAGDEKNDDEEGGWRRGRGGSSSSSASSEEEGGGQAAAADCRFTTNAYTRAVSSRRGRSRRDAQEENLVSSMDLEIDPIHSNPPNPQMDDLPHRPRSSRAGQDPRERESDRGRSRTFPVTVPALVRETNPPSAASVNLRQRSMSLGTLGTIPASELPPSPPYALSYDMSSTKNPLGRTLIDNPPPLPLLPPHLTRQYMEASQTADEERRPRLGQRRPSTSSLLSTVSSISAITVESTIPPVGYSYNGFRETVPPPHPGDRRQSIRSGALPYYPSNAQRRRDIYHSRPSLPPSASTSSTLSPLRSPSVFTLGSTYSDSSSTPTPSTITPSTIQPPLSPTTVETFGYTRANHYARRGFSAPRLLLSVSPPLSSSTFYPGSIFILTLSLGDKVDVKSFEKLTVSLIGTCQVRRESAMAKLRADRDLANKEGRRLKSSKGWGGTFDDHQFLGVTTKVYPTAEEGVESLTLPTGALPPASSPLKLSPPASFTSALSSSSSSTVSTSSSSSSPSIPSPPTSSSSASNSPPASAIIKVGPTIGDHRSLSALSSLSISESRAEKAESIGGGPGFEIPTDVDGSASPNAWRLTIAVPFERTCGCEHKPNGMRRGLPPSFTNADVHISYRVEVTGKRKEKFAFNDKLRSTFTLALRETDADHEQVGLEYACAL